MKEKLRQSSLQQKTSEIEIVFYPHLSNAEEFIIIGRNQHFLIYFCKHSSFQILIRRYYISLCFMNINFSFLIYFHTAKSQLVSKFLFGVSSHSMFVYISTTVDDQISLLIYLDCAIRLNSRYVIPQQYKGVLLLVYRKSYILKYGNTHYHTVKS